MTRFILALMALTASACTAAPAQAPAIEIAPAPLAGYTCFLVRAESGQVVGGNCVRD